MSTDRIELRGLQLLARCGVLSHEQAHDQPLEIDLDLTCDLAPAGQTDALADTVDYGAVCDLVARVARQPVALLEHLAQRLADALLEEDRRIESVTLTVRKLRPPVPHQLATSGVRIQRRRS